MSEHYVLDTGPLIDFFVLTFEEETGARWLRGCVPPQGVRFPAERGLFETFLQERRGWLLTAPGVVAELENHVQRLVNRCKPHNLQDAFRARFWGLVCDRWRAWDIREAPVSLSELDPEIVAKHGPVDASLLRLVQAAAKGERRVLLTNERALFGLCVKQRLPAHIVATWIRSLLSGPDMHRI